MKAFILLFALLASGSAAGQAPRPPARSDSLTAPLATSLAAPDTVAAIHRLFVAKRKKNSRFFAGTLGVTAIGGVVTGTAPSSWDGLGQAVLGVAIIALVSLPALTVEAITALDYNKKSERQAVEDFQAHKVPRYLKRKLKPKYFQNS